MSLDDKSTRLLEICGNQEVTLSMTKCGIYGPAGSGKTTLRHLFLGKDHPVTHESTDILADVDLISPNLDLAEDLVSVKNLSGETSKSTWVEIKDQQMLHLIANTMSTSKSINIDEEDKSEGDQHSIADFKVIKQLKEHLKHKLKLFKQGALSRKEKLETLDKIKLIHLVDSGGQSQFLEVLPIFARNSSAHLLVHPLNQRLDGIPPFKYSVDGKKYTVDQEMLLTHEENIIHCIQCIISSRCRQGVQKSRFEIPKEPHIAVVGMFNDKIQHDESKIDQRNAKISKCITNLKNLKSFNFELITSSRGLQKPVYAFDGSESGWKCEENASELFSLQSGIADERRMIPVTLPLKWFIFLQAIKEDTQRKGKNYLTLEECRKTAQAREIRMSTIETDEALQLFDELNLILYFPSILRHIVFTIPAFLYRKVTHLITESFTNTDLKADIYTLKRKTFHDTGIFSLDLVTGSDFSCGFCENFQITDFLKLLKTLCIISGVGNNFFMPCVLPLEKNKQLDLSFTEADLPPLYISFGDNLSPRGLFCATISSLAAISMFEVDTTRSLKRNCIELIVFEDNDDSHEPAGSMVLWDKMNRFEVYCLGCDSTILPVVRKCLVNAIFKAANVMHYDFGNVKLSIGLGCTVCDEDEDHGTVVSKKRNIWFSKCLKNTRKHAQQLQSDDQRLSWFYENPVENGMFLNNMP